MHCCTEKCVVVHLRFCVSACSRVYFCCQVQTYSHSFSTSASSASAPAASFTILITYLGVFLFNLNHVQVFNFLHTNDYNYLIIKCEAQSEKTSYINIIVLFLVGVHFSIFGASRAP